MQLGVIEKWLKAQSFPFALGFFFLKPEYSIFLEINDT